MPAPLKYPWPESIGAEYAVPAPDRDARSKMQSCAHNFAYRRKWVFRTRWDGEALRVRRVA